MIRMEDPDVDVEWEIEEYPSFSDYLQEDPDVEWEIEEYPSSSDYLQEGEGKKSKVKWILEKSLGIGKKVIITGFVVTSVPLILPSVIVVSTIGLSVSVPFGVMFTSYVCTQTLMNKLLPIPTSYPMLEYEEEINKEIEYFIMEEEEDMKERIEEIIELETYEKNELDAEYEDDLKDIEQYDERGNDGIVHVNLEDAENEEMEDLKERVETRLEILDDGKELAREEDEREEMKDLKGVVEKRIELVEHENELAWEDDDYDLRAEEERLANEGEHLEEEGYEEDVEDDIEVPGVVIDMKIENELACEDDDYDLRAEEERLANEGEHLEEKGYMEDVKDDVEVPEVVVDLKIENVLARENDDYDLGEAEERLAKEGEHLEEEGYEEDVEDDIEVPEGVIDMKIENELACEDVDYDLREVEERLANEEGEEGYVEDVKDDIEVPEVGVDVKIEKVLAREDDDYNLGVEEERMANEGGCFKAEVYEGDEDDIEVPEAVVDVKTENVLAREGDDYDLGEAEEMLANEGGYFKEEGYVEDVKDDTEVPEVVIDEKIENLLACEDDDHDLGEAEDRLANEGGRFKEEIYEGDVDVEVPEVVVGVKIEKVLAREDDDYDLGEAEERLASEGVCFKEEGYVGDVKDDIEVPEVVIDEKIENVLAREDDDHDLGEAEERLANEGEHLEEEAYEEDVEDDIEVPEAVVGVKIENVLAREDDDYDLGEAEERLASERGCFKEEGYVEDVENDIEVPEVVIDEKIENEDVTETEENIDEVLFPEIRLIIARTIVGEILKDERVTEDEDDGDMEEKETLLLEKIMHDGNVEEEAEAEEDGLSLVAITEKSIKEEDTHVHLLDEDYTMGDERDSGVLEENVFETERLLEEGCLMENLRKRRRTNEDNIGLVAEEVEPESEPEPEPEPDMEDILAENDDIIVEEKLIEQEQTGEGVESDSNYLIMEHEEILVCSNRVMTETAADENDTSEVESNYEGTNRATEYVLKENVDLIEIPITEFNSKPEQRDNSSQTDSEVHLEKDSIVGEKKIWEQIDALRTIVGYKGNHKKSCFDEVKDLYIFTGVEPPSSFENTKDLDELNHKLKFLMSIVGVK